MHKLKLTVKVTIIILIFILTLILMSIPSILLAETIKLMHKVKPKIKTATNKLELYLPIFLIVFIALWYFSSTNLSGSAIARVVAAAILIFFLWACNALQKDRETSLEHKITKNTTPAKYLGALIPAGYALLTFTAIFSMLFASGFYDIEKLSNTEILEILSSKDAIKNNPGTEAIARGVWAISMGTIIVISGIVCWTATETWREWKANPIAVRAFANLALVLALILIILGLDRKFFPAFGSQVSLNMLNAIWCRSERYFLGPLTDGLNTVAIGISAIVAGTFCLLQRAVMITESATIAKPRPGTKKPAEPPKNILTATKRIQDQMDRALYVGAMALMAGLFEVVATLYWSYAPFDNTAKIKLQADMCKALPVYAASEATTSFTKTIQFADCAKQNSQQLMPACNQQGLSAATAASAASAAMAAMPVTCKELPGKVEAATAVDDLQQFTRSLGIVFGASFSALLAAMYLPVALAYQRHVERMKNEWPDFFAQQKNDASGTPESSGLEHSMVQHLFNVLAALGPLGIGLLSAVFGL